jgi:iron(III) transport system permease protein
MAEAVTRTSPLPDTHVAFWQRVDSKWILIGIPIALVVWLSLVPLVFLLWQSFLTPQTASRPAVFTLENFQTAYFSAETFRLFFNSVQFAVGTAVFALCLGTALAWMNERTNTPFKRLFFALSLIPLVIPGILFTVSWIMLGSPKIGILNVWLQWLFNTDEVFINIYTMAGMIWVEGLHYSPMAFLLMTAAFRSMDPSLEESALMSGASILQIAWKITLKLAWPAAAGALLILLVRALESFEVPALLGLPNGIWVFTSRIWVVLNEKPPSFSKAGAYAMSLLLLTSIGVLWQSRLSKRSRAYQTVTGKGFRPRPIRLGVWRIPAVLFILAYFLIAVAAPLLIIAYASTQVFYTPPTHETLSNMSLQQYKDVINNDIVVTALKNSLILGIGVATAAMLVTAVAAWIVIRTQIPGRWMVDNLAFAPLVVPGLVLGVALLFVYLRVERDFRIGIFGSLWILFIAYFTRYMPYGMRYSSTSMFQIGRELEESAQTSGASWFQAFRRVVLPLLVPGLVAGWIYILIVSVRELSSSILLYSPGNEVLSIVIWEQYQNGQFTQLAALGMMMVGALVVLVTIAYKLGARIGVRET